MTDQPISHDPATSDNRLQSTGGMILTGVLVLVFIVLIAQINRRISSGHSGDFRHFYFAAEALLEHRDLYADTPLNIVEHALGRPAGPVEKAWYTTDTDRYLYPPLIAMLYTPIARLRFDIAQRIILIVDALLVYAGILLTTRAFIDRFELTKSTLLFAATALLGVLLNLDKIHVELQMFQTNALMFAMFATSLYWLDRRPIAAGIPLGIILNIKYLSLATLPWLLVRRRWKTAGSCIASTIVFALLPALISGWHTNLQNLAVAYGGLLHMVGVSSGSVEQANVDDIRDYLSCSITSAMARTPIGRHNLSIGLLMAAGIAMVAVLLVIWLYRRNRVPIFAWPEADQQAHQPWKTVTGLEFVSIVAATLCFSPQTNTRHLMLALLLTIPMSALILASRQRFVVLIGAVVLCVGFIFPPGGQAPASHRRAIWWFGHGGQSWCLLFAIFTLVSAGLSRATEKEVAPRMHTNEHE
jgi:hypothetical protein